MGKMIVSASRLSRELQDKVTAVEYAVKWLTPFVSVQQKYIDELLKEAKEMEKQQIIDAYHINPLESKWNNIGENYYKETYEKK